MELYGIQNIESLEVVEQKNSLWWWVYAVPSADSDQIDVVNFFIWSSVWMDLYF